MKSTNKLLCRWIRKFRFIFSLHCHQQVNSCWSLHFKTAWKIQKVTTSRIQRLKICHNLNIALCFYCINSLSKTNKLTHLLLRTAPPTPLIPFLWIKYRFLGTPHSDWIQGYMYRLGCRGLCFSNPPVSSLCGIDFLDMSASHCLGFLAWECRQWAPSSLVWATAALAGQTTPRIIPNKKINWYKNTVKEGYRIRVM